MIYFNKTKILPNISNDSLIEYKKSISKKNYICKAPFSVLYFHPDGEVGACCLNKGMYNYGFYPQKSINAIINSDSRKKHQAYLKNHNYSLGCMVCKSQIEAKDFKGLLINTFSNNSKSLEQIDFELSNYCNLNCIMCERDKSRVRIPIYTSDFITEIRPILKKIKVANFFGGEPFLIKEYFEIWEILRKDNPKCKIYVQTNGSIYNQQIKQLITHKSFRVGISIDSLNKKLFEKIRTGANFEKIINNFLIFNTAMKKNNTDMHISVCPLRLNWREIPDLVDFANSNKCSIFFNYVEYPKALSLRHAPSGFLAKIISNNNNYLAKQKKSNKFNNNIETLKSFTELISSWHRESHEIEKNATFLSKSDFTKLLTTKFNNKEPEILNKIINILPKELIIDNDRLIEIDNFDFLNYIKIKNTQNHSVDSIVEEARSFFQLYRTENIEDE